MHQGSEGISQRLLQLGLLVNFPGKMGEDQADTPGVGRASPWRQGKTSDLLSWRGGSLSMYLVLTQ